MRAIKARMVMVDFDRREPSGKIFTRWAWLSQALWPGSVWNVEMERSPSGRGWHFWAAVLNKRKLNSMQVLLCQCLMGSDIGRERYNFTRIKAGEKDWNWLFSTKRKKLYRRKK